MSKENRPVALQAKEAPLRAIQSMYPAPFAKLTEGREKRVLGDAFGLTNFGVNFVTLAPHSVSALRHAHQKQDEFVYILQGYPTLQTDQGDTPLSPGMCAGFRAGTGDAHRLINQTDEDVVYLEIGDRSEGDGVHYPDDDIQAKFLEGAWRFFHKDGTPYPEKS
ncbi:MAG: cupin domain-containing protein [Myxococcales bacterium]|nr:cupin domain-containing protein [Myxococcales bacterium]